MFIWVLVEQGMKLLPAILQTALFGYAFVVDALHDKRKAELDKEFGRRISPFKS